MEFPKDVGSRTSLGQLGSAKYASATHSDASILSQRLKELGLLGTTLSNESLELVRALFCDDPPTVAKTDAGFEIKAPYPGSDMMLLSLAQEFQDSHMPRRAVDLLAAAAACPSFTPEQRLTFLQRCAKIVSGGFEPKPATATLLAIHSKALTLYGGFGAAAAKVLDPLLIELGSEAEETASQISAHLVSLCIAQASTAYRTPLGKEKAAWQVEDMLISAVKAGDTPFAQLLLTALKGFADADPSGPAKKVLNGLHAASVNGIPLLHIACRHCDSALVEQLVLLGADIGLTTKKDSQTPLHIACKWGNKQVVKLLIDRRADLNAKDAQDATPLHAACQGGDAELVHLLVESKADVAPKNSAGITPLHFAAANGDSPIVELLLRNKASVDDKTREGATALHFACQRGNLDVAVKLIENNADVNSGTVPNVKPIHLAAASGRQEIVSELLRRSAEIDVITNEGATPLYMACQQGRVEVARQLIQVAPKQVDRGTNGDTTPLFCAIQQGNVPLATLLLQHGAQFNRKLSLPGPMRVAIAAAQVQVTAEGISLPTGKQHVPLEKGDTLFHLACRIGDLDMVWLLIQEKADVNKPDANGCTPLHIACEAGNRKLATRLIEAQADVHAVTPQGVSPLHVACERGDFDLVSLLMEQGASLNQKDLQGKSPAGMAVEAGHQQMLQRIGESSIMAQKNS